MQDFDLVVIGAGAAGLTAATFAARYGLKVVVVERVGAGGQIVNADSVENFPGFPGGIAGHELGPLLHEQAEAAGATFALDTVAMIEPAGALHLVRAAAGAWRARAVIIAAMVGVLALTAGMLVLERLIVTEREAVEDALDGVASALATNDPPQVLAYFAPESPQAPVGPAEMDDQALIAALAQSRLADSVQIASEAGCRRLSAAVPALAELCLRLAGFGMDRLVPEQVAALEALANHEVHRKPTPFPAGT